MLTYAERAGTRNPTLTSNARGDDGETKRQKERPSVFNFSFLNSLGGEKTAYEVEGANISLMVLRIPRYRLFFFKKIKERE